MKKSNNSLIKHIYFGKNKFLQPTKNFGFDKYQILQFCKKVLREEKKSKFPIT